MLTNHWSYRANWAWWTTCSTISFYTFRTLVERHNHHKWWSTAHITRHASMHTSIMQVTYCFRNTAIYVSITIPQWLIVINLGIKKRPYDRYVWNYSVWPYHKWLVISWWTKTPQWCGWCTTTLFSQPRSYIHPWHCHLISSCGLYTLLYDPLLCNIPNVMKHKGGAAIEVLTYSSAVFNAAYMYE